MDDLTRVLLVGVGATALTDLWGLARRPLFGVPAPDYGMVGRWIGLMAHGRFRHASISRAPRVTGERALGWAIHYLTGIAYAALLWLVAGSHWLRNPTPGVALAIGIATVAAPFLLMQPGMGAGIASRLTPHPARARVHSVLMHAVFGLGLYLAALALRGA
jgi:hypothetical protein